MTKISIANVIIERRVRVAPRPVTVADRRITGKLGVKF
jgi:hypothetical protein